MAIAAMDEPMGVTVVFNADDYPVSVHEDAKEAAQMCAHYDAKSGPYKTLTMWGDLSSARNV